MQEFQSVLQLATNGLINKTNESNNKAKRESILEKIEADIYTEKVKKGKNLTKSEAEAIISQYGSVDQTAGKLTTTEGGHEIPLSEIIGWQQAK